VLAAPPARLIRTGALVVAGLLAALTATAQTSEPRFDAIGIGDGLPSPNVSSLVQDRTGFLWIGTEGGLVRYDGAEMRLYGSDPSDPASLSSSFVQHVREDDAGALWVATFGGGLNRLDPQTGRARAWRHDPPGRAA
jgi:ligand-binding sensor domain-containing protein